MARHGDAARPPDTVIDAYALDPASVEPVASGLINRTWTARARTGERRVLQHVNPLFGVPVQHDIEAVTSHLDACGIPTPRLVPTASGTLFLLDGEHVYRLLTYVDGVSHDHIDDPALAAEAGRVLAEFHAGLGSFTGRLSGSRPNIHVLPRHLATLDAALALGHGHRAYGEVAPLAAEVVLLAGALPPFAAGPDRYVHGDPKISNVMFERGGTRAICLVDLDTLTRMPILLELGDAFRSWCNPLAEDSPAARFEAELFEAACRGYGARVDGSLLPAEAWRAVPAATATSAIELAARFCADALNETYFRWDPARYASASEHNQARTRGQLALARSILEQLEVLSRIAHAAGT